MLQNLPTGTIGLPLGLRGYEGQPGNQGGPGAPGLRGYEGQPGNQGGPKRPR